MGVVEQGIPNMVYNFSLIIALNKQKIKIESTHVSLRVYGELGPRAPHVVPWIPRSLEAAARQEPTLESRLAPDCSLLCHSQGLNCVSQTHMLKPWCTEPQM